jgi:hypothetical protein
MALPASFAAPPAAYVDAEADLYIHPGTDTGGNEHAGTYGHQHVAGYTDRDTYRDICRYAYGNDLAHADRHRRRIRDSDRRPHGNTVADGNAHRPGLTNGNTGPPHGDRDDRAAYCDGNKRVRGDAHLGGHAYYAGDAHADCAANGNGAAYRNRAAGGNRNAHTYGHLHAGARPYPCALCYSDAYPVSDTHDDQQRVAW